MGPNGKIGLPPLRLSAPPGNSARSAALAQLVEHRIRNAGVTGSSPVSGTIPLTNDPADLQAKGRSAMAFIWVGFGVLAAMLPF